MDRKNHPVESSNKNPESLGITCHVVLVMSSLICKLYLMEGIMPCGRSRVATEARNLSLGS